jgi:hypothetical protein
MSITFLPIKENNFFERIKYIMARKADPENEFRTLN